MESQARIVSVLVPVQWVKLLVSIGIGLAELSRRRTRRLQFDTTSRFSDSHGQETVAMLG